MSITIIRLLLDFGLVVLIWMIQRIVYPSFLDYNTENLVVWHRKYTNRLSPIVIPLMFGQLSVIIYQIAKSFNLYTVFSLVIILLIWIATFLQFVPIHSNISKGRMSERMLKELVNKNWIRTVLWTLLFLSSLYWCLIC